MAATGSIVVVGAPGENVSGDRFAGRVYIFDAGTGALKSTLTSPNSQAEGEFGFSVAASGGSVVVDSEEVVGGNQTVSRLYVFNVATSALTSTLTTPNSEANTVWESSVAVYGSTVVVGVPDEIVGGSQEAGRTYLFQASLGTSSISTTGTGGIPEFLPLLGAAVLIVVAVVVGYVIVRGSRRS